MLEYAIKGSKKYWMLLGFWGLLIAIGFGAYLVQLNQGLSVTGMSRDVSWGFYISQFTFLVGVAASAVMVVIPYYLHNHKVFAKTVIMGEFLAVAACMMCMLFVTVDMGQPMRVMNVMLYPTPNSVMMYDIIVLSGYLLINLTIGSVTLEAERKRTAYPAWIKPLIYLSIPWAVSIHTVTAFLYSGLEGRPFWMTAILAPRFLASAFASGPSLLIILSLIVKKVSKFDVGKEAINTLGTVVTYALCVNLFFLGTELFTGLYSDMPHHMHAFEYLFVGLDGHNALVPWMRTGITISVITTILFLFPKIRKNHGILPILCVMAIVAIWIEKGMGMVVTGFIPNPLGHITEYTPTGIELLVSLGVYAIGFFVLTVLYKIIIGVRENQQGDVLH